MSLEELREAEELLTSLAAEKRTAELSLIHLESQIYALVCCVVVWRDG
jgi:hypothetical protein